METLNLKLFSLINADDGLRGWHLALSVFVAEYVVYLLPFLLVVLWLWGSSRCRPTLLLAALATATSLLLNQMIGWVWFHPRPFADGLGHSYLAHVPDSSFPSDHVTVVWATAAALIRDQRMRLLGAGVALVGFAVAWTRVYLGVHFPLDMVGAALVPVFSFPLLAYPWRRLGNGIMEKTERLYHTVFAIPIAMKWVRP